MMRIADLMRESGVGFGTSGARGLVSQMTPDVCYAYTAAFLREVATEGQQVVLGHDLRPSSPAIASACAAAIAAAGRRVVYCGALPTPALAWYAARLGAPAQVVTGSHIPFDRNGIKFYRPEGEISKADEQAMQTAIIDLPAIEPQMLPAVDPAAAASYRRRYGDFFGAGCLTGTRIALYEHSSVARDLLRQILEQLGAKVISLGRTDTFVPIDTEAVRPEDVAQARRWAQEIGFDAILSTDGDADRPLIGDERGEWLRGDLVGLLCAHYLGADLVVTPVSSNTALERSGWFSRVIRTRIGSPYVIEAMQAASKADPGAIVVGYEANGGFLLGSDVMRNGRLLGALPTRDAVLPMLALLSLARERGCRPSQLAGQLPARFTASDRLQAFAPKLSRALIERLLTDREQAKQTMAPDSGAIVQVDITDGLRLSFANGDIVHLRPSGNAPELRCYAEASSATHAQQLCNECLRRLTGLVL